MEISLSAPIAEGRTAEIYEWKDGFILKLYHNWCPSHWAEQESKVAHAVVAAGIPTPAAGEIVEVNGRRGIIYERVTGISMLQDLNVRPWKVRQHARSLAELQVKINQLSISGLPSYKEGLIRTIQRAPHLSDALRDKVLNLLSTLNDGEKICHGDFHPGNVLLTERGAVVIDWMTASVGNPWADVARTSLLLTIGPRGAGKQISPVIRAFIKLFHQQYIKQYLKLMPDDNSQRNTWMPIIAAARLDEQIEPECEALIDMVQAGLMG